MDANVFADTHASRLAMDSILLPLIVLLIVAFDLAAIRFGADSRDR